MSRDLRLPSLEGLRAFEAAARLGSFERAADELNVTASAIGKRIAALEDLLGMTLFSRGARALALTAGGKEYLSSVGAALGLLSSLPQHRRTAQRSDRLRVCAPPTFAREILVQHLEHFSSCHPDVELEIVLSIPYLGAESPDADIEVRHVDATLPGGTVLMHDLVVPMAAPALLDRLPPLRTPADLRHAPLLRTPIEPWAPWFAAAGLDWPEPATGPKFVDLGLTLEAALSGQGVVLARPALAHRWLDSGALRAPFPALRATPLRQYVLLPHAAQGASAVFARWLTTICAVAALRGVAALSRQA